MIGRKTRIWFAERTGKTIKSGKLTEREKAILLFVKRYMKLERYLSKVAMQESGGISLFIEAVSRLNDLETPPSKPGKALSTIIDELKIARLYWNRITATQEKIEQIGPIPPLTFFVMNYIKELVSCHKRAYRRLMIDYIEDN